MTDYTSSSPQLSPKAVTMVKLCLLVYPSGAITLGLSSVHLPFAEAWKNFRVIKPRLMSLLGWFCFHRKDLHKKPNSPLAAAGVLPGVFLAPWIKNLWKLNQQNQFSFGQIPGSAIQPAWSVILLVISAEKPSAEQPTGQPAARPLGMALWTRLTLGPLDSCSGPLPESSGDFTGTTPAPPVDFNLSNH